MSFFEASARVPLIVRGIGGAGAVRTTAVSLLDVAPTLIELAGGPSPADEPADDVVDGAVGGSLLGLVGGAVGDADPDPDRTVLGEYLAEGAVAPIFMIRRGDHKFVWSPADPPQLYDLTADPHELVNRAGDDPAADRFEAEVQRRWDVEAVDAAVRRSQAERRLVDRALRQGRHTPWDHQPRVDASQQYMRNHLDLDDVEASRRL